MARYRITETSYINDRLVAEEAIIEVADDLVPGPHMQPRDDAARKAVKAAGQRMAKVDPVESLTQRPAEAAA